MKRTNIFVKNFGMLRTMAAVLTVLPLVVLPIMGMVWLWQSNMRIYWFMALIGCGFLGYILHFMLSRIERKQVPANETRANPMWPASADECWAKVETLARDVSPKQWPLNDVEKLALLGRNTLEIVAGHFHSDRKQPLLELTVPHTLLIIELACRDLRKEIVEHVPFSHQMTVGSLVRANYWFEIIKPYHNWYRAIRSIVDPASALFSEIRRSFSKNIMDHGMEMMKTWLLREYVLKTGYYAIQLYSDGLLVNGDDPRTKVISDLKEDEHKGEIFQKSGVEPLRVLVLGRSNAGKSSLINALFGKQITATDILPHTTQELVPYCLEREGHLMALVFDAPGCDTQLFGEKALRDEVLQADLILWVTAANRAGRGMERERIEMIRESFVQRPSRRPPPMLAIVTHIDRLRPLREWSPPYDLNNPQNKKAENIADAVATIASDLNVEISRIIPVCLVPDRIYNVEDTLWAAILNQQDEADRARFLRCLETRRKKENWTLLWRQLASGGRILAKLPERIISSASTPRQGSSLWQFSGKL